jgi:tripartite-type tricarboxylate transporter receptor subunit TctC
VPANQTGNSRQFGENDMTTRSLLTRRSILRSGGVAIAATALGRPAHAAAYPDRPVRIIAPFGAGGPSDLLARLLSVKLGEKLGETFIVENRPGAGSNIGTAAVARATPDGYTLLVTSSAFVVNPGLYKEVPYDPAKDFAPIAELVTSPNVFIATPASGINSIAELVALAKEKPDTLSYASAGIGTTPHLAGEWLKSVAGINITHVPYGGAGPALQAILAGTVPLMCAALPGAHPLIDRHDVRALAVTGAERWYDLPDVPTMIEAGYKDFVSDTFHGMLAPAATPPDIVGRLTTAVLETLRAPEFREKLHTLGFEVIGNGPDGLRKRIEVEVPRYRELIDKAGIQRV